MSVTMKIEGLDRLGQALLSLPDTVEAGVKVIGPPVGYALVWEWGSARMHQPGPKTLWSTNPAGAPAILTLTAPMGYIRVNRTEYLRMILEEYHKLDLKDRPFAEWGRALSGAFALAAQRCAELISITAPIDTGELRASIVPAVPGDQTLEGTANTYGPTEYGLGQEWMP